MLARPAGAHRVLSPSSEEQFTLNTAGALNVRGFGQSKYGHFDIRGTCSADLQDLTMYVFCSIVVVTCFCSQLPGVLGQAGAAIEGVGAGGAWCADVVQAVGQGPLSRAGGGAVDVGTGPQAWRICKKAKNGPSSSAARGAAQQQQPPAAESSTSKRASARPRKAPSHLRTSPEQRMSVAMSQLPEPLRKCCAVDCQLERAPGARRFMTEVGPVALGVLHYRSIVRSTM